MHLVYLVSLKNIRVSCTWILFTKNYGDRWAGNVS